MTTSLSSIMTKYAPTTLADYVTFDLKLQIIIHGYTHGTMSRPLLLAGTHGCGKTQLATLLAANLFAGIAPQDIHFIDVSADTGIDTVRKVDRLTHTWALNEHNLRVVILDEVDCFTVPAMNALKGLMTKFASLDQGVFFIMTTNHLGSISAPVRDRCQVYTFPASTVDDVYHVAEKVLTAEGVPFDPVTIQKAIQTDNSGLASYRDMWGTLETILTMRDMK